MAGWVETWKQLQESNCRDKDEQNPFCQKEYHFIYGEKLQFCYDSIIIKKKKKKKPALTTLQILTTQNIFFFHN